MKKIGIITIHSDLNYGAFLQAFALTTFLNNNSYYTRIIDYRKIPNSPRIYKFPKNIIYKIFTVKLSITYIIPGLISRHPLNL